MIVLIAVHEDGNILGQIKLSLTSQFYLGKMNYGIDKEHVSSWFNELDMEICFDLLMPMQISEFINQHKNADSFFMDDSFHDDSFFNYDKWKVKIRHGSKL